MLSPLSGAMESLHFKFLAPGGARGEGLRSLHQAGKREGAPAPFMLAVHAAP
jgi:hypothetical protein